MASIGTAREGRGLVALAVAPELAKVNQEALLKYMYFGYIPDPATAFTPIQKLPPGHLILYPSTSLHHVRPVTRGARLCSFFWIQSMVRDDGRRAILFDLDLGIQRLNRELPNHPAAVQFTGVYHNLLRQSRYPLRPMALLSCHASLISI